MMVWLGYCNGCGWMGRDRPSVEAALDDANAHVEGHNTRVVVVNDHDDEFPGEIYCSICDREAHERKDSCRET